MNTEAFFPLGAGTENQIFVYRMGRLCGGAHEISGIKVPLFLWVGGWRVLGVGGWVGGGGVGRDGWVMGCGWWGDDGGGVGGMLVRGGVGGVESG